jgi:hypothetical protein
MQKSGPLFEISVRDTLLEGFGESPTKIGQALWNSPERGTPRPGGEELAGKRRTGRGCQATKTAIAV